MGDETYDLYGQNNFGQTPTFGTGSYGGYDFGSSLGIGNFDFGGGSGANDFSLDSFYSYILPSNQATGGESSGGNPITDMLSSAWNSFNEAEPKTKQSLMQIGWLALSGAMGAKGKDRLLKTQEKTANASMLNAQTAQQLANSKISNQGAMGKTTFGAPRTKKPGFINLLATRQSNPGNSSGTGGGLIGGA